MAEDIKEAVKPVTDWKVMLYGNYKKYPYEIRSREYADGTASYSTTVLIKKPTEEKEDTIYAIDDYMNLGVMTEVRKPKEGDWLNGQIPAGNKYAVVWATPSNVFTTKIVENLMREMHDFIDRIVKCGI